MDWAKQHFNLTIKSVSRPENASGFVVLPCRWGVACSLAWMMHARCGLVLNAAVLWTSRYLDASVAYLRALPAEERKHNVLDEDVARVFPLKHANLNCLRRYSFAARPPREGLRLLRDPATVHLNEDDDTEE